MTLSVIQAWSLPEFFPVTKHCDFIKSGKLLEKCSFASVCTAESPLVLRHSRVCWLWYNNASKECSWAWLGVNAWAGLRPHPAVQHQEPKGARWGCGQAQDVSAAHQLPWNLLLISYLVQIWAVKDSEYLACWQDTFSFILPSHGHRLEHTDPPQSHGIFHLESGHDGVDSLHCPSWYSVMYFKVYFTGNHESFVSMFLQIFTHLAFFIQRKFNSFICI